MYDRSVHLNVIVDPQVMGGMSIQIGDDLIDGSVATRLAALRRRLAA
jgi:F-type H+-transporting ATPase subunit delta